MSLGFHGIPLAKFSGVSCGPGGMTLREWHDEFGQIASPYKLEETAKMRALFDHLTGAVKDEVMCLLDSK